jgi:hypothetical protein
MKLQPVGEVLLAVCEVFLVVHKPIGRRTDQGSGVGKEL